MGNNLLAILALTLGIFRPMELAAQSAKTPEVQPLRPARVSGFSDEAAFLLYLDGSLILTNFVSWKESGTFHSNGEGVVEGSKIRMATTLFSDPAGCWAEVRMEMPIHKTGVRRTGDMAVLTLPDGKTKTVPLRPGVFPFVGMVGLNLYTRFYDEQKGGRQLLPILIPHKKAAEISLERKRRFQQMFAGKKLELREFELKAEDLTALIWVDDGNRLIKSGQPEEKSLFIRQGYESLRGQQ